jgi:para-nitrobenzyl esterase
MSPEQKGAGAAAARSAPADPVVQATAGKMRGSIQAGLNVFKGISNGPSTAGARRLQPPGKAEPLTSVRDALELGPKAPQLLMTLPPEIIGLSEGMTSDDPMGEDCLCLNVWWAGLGSARRRPVMFWLHGGACTAGSGGSPIYDGTALAARHDVVVVTVTHRFTVLGYLFLGDLGGEKYADSGNAGMLDIVAALEWVRENIAEFGGDPESVTIFGESGGGMKVTTLMAKPAAQGLFHAAIVQSGAFLKALPRERTTKGAEAFRAKLGLKASQLDELHKISTDRGLEAMAAIPGGPLGLAPAADDRSLPAGPFDPAAPAMSAKVPMLIGSNATEMTLLEPPPDDIDDATLLARIKPGLRIDDAAAEPLIAVYKKFTGATSKRTWLWSRILSCGSTQSFRPSARPRKPRRPRTWITSPWKTPVMNGRLRSPRSVEIPFVLDNIGFWKGLTGEGEDSSVLAAKMNGARAAFAHTGNPSHRGLPTWPVYTSDHRATIPSDDECKISGEPGRAERVASLAGGGGSVSMF